MLTGGVMYLIPVFLFAFSANIDSFIIGISYGIKKTFISLKKNILISLITLAGTTLALLSGSGILRFCPVSYANFIGRLLLLSFGIYYLLKSLILHFRGSKPLPSDSEIESQELTFDDIGPSSCSPRNQLSRAEALLLGFSLSANNLGIGMSASIAGLAVLPAAPISFLFCILFLYLGNIAGKSQIFQKAGQYADFICGLLLMILGVCQ